MEDRLKRPLQATLSPLMFAVLGTLVGVAVGAVGGIFGKGIEMWLRSQGDYAEEIQTD